jgi:hypothetical protein
MLLVLFIPVDDTLLSQRIVVWVKIVVLGDNPAANDKTSKSMA